MSEKSVMIRDAAVLFSSVYLWGFKFFLYSFLCFLGFACPSQATFWPAHLYFCRVKLPWTMVKIDRKTLKPYTGSC